MILKNQVFLQVVLLKMSDNLILTEQEKQEITLAVFKINCFYQALRDAKIIKYIAIQPLTITEIIHHIEQKWPIKGLNLSYLTATQYNFINYEYWGFQPKFTISSENRFLDTAASWKLFKDDNIFRTYYSSYFGEYSDTFKNFDEMFIKCSSYFLQDQFIVFDSFFEDIILNLIQDKIIKNFEQARILKNEYTKELEILKIEIENPSELVQSLWDLNILTQNINFIPIV